MMTEKITEQINGKEPELMPLSQIPKGKKVTIVALNLSDDGALRLSAMGLNPGTRIRVIDNSRSDTSIIECRGTRLALGRGLPNFIEVK